MVFNNFIVFSDGIIFNVEWFWKVWGESYFCNILFKFGNEFVICFWYW